MMTYEQAVRTISIQEKNLRKLNGIRFIEGGYEYRITYRGGFAAYVAIDRRKVGTRNFYYFSGVGAYNCWLVSQVLDLIKAEIERKVARK